MTQLVIRSKYLNRIETGELEAIWSASGSRILRYQIDLKHRDLDLYKCVSAPEIFILQNKIDVLLAGWDRKYEAYQEKTTHLSEAAIADQLTAKAMDKLHALDIILSDSLERSSAIDWEAMKDRAPFGLPFRALRQPTYEKNTQSPTYSSPEITWWDKITGKKVRKLQSAEIDFQERMKLWERSEQMRYETFQQALSEWREQTKSSMARYKEEEAKFHKEQAEANSKIDKVYDSISAGATEGVIEQMTMVLDRSDYGDLFEKDFELNYSSADRLLMIDYRLPSPDKMPTLKGVRYIKATGEGRRSYISEREQQQNFDKTCYQICLRTLHEVFDADVDTNIDSVALNGFTNYIDKATGKDIEACIMSIVVTRSDLVAIDLSRIDPKSCFKSLKGVSASSLASLAPVAPLIKLNKSDSRFIEARDTISQVGETTNLASMDWEDFEHLVRGLFEKEFAARGGEVKITQSSSDGGVDAVAFDPDPITGGKIVIQAKRYTKTVGVSAIRDLYGTMQHESASRGILVTTADFGPDAHRFAAGKPITLLTGANLLHMLERHGTNARIDIREARKVLNLRDYGR